MKKFIGNLTAIVGIFIAIFMCGSAKYIEWTGIINQDLKRFWLGIGIFIGGIVIAMICLAVKELTKMIK